MNPEDFEQFVKEDFEQLVHELYSSREVILAIANILSAQEFDVTFDVTKETVRATWEKPTHVQRDLIKKQAVFSAIMDGLKNGDKLYWGDESFVIAVLANDLVDEHNAECITESSNDKYHATEFLRDIEIN